MPGHPQGPVGRSVGWHLVLYGAAMLLPLLLAGSCLFWQGAREEQRRIDEGVRSVALTIAQDLDREMTHIQAICDAAPVGLCVIGCCVHDILPDLAGQAETALAQPGGAFLLASRPGEGSTATLILPVAKGAAEKVKPPSLRLPDSTRPLTVLVVDDDPLVAMGHVAMLEDIGHAVIEASSGREALELLEANPGVHVVITDQAMPGMTGAELAERIRELRPGLPIILATGGIGPGQSPAEMRVQLPRLSKPFRQSDLALAPLAP